MTTQMKAFYDLPFLSVDTETTGIDPFNDRIVTVSMVLNYPDTENRPDVIKEWLINPGVDIPESASNVHGVSNEMAQEHGVDAGEALLEIGAIFNNWHSTGNPVIIYNAQYDATLLRAEFDRYNVSPTSDFSRVIDPLVLDRYTDKWRKGKRTLEAVSALYGVNLENAHNASADSIAAAQIARRMGAKYNMNHTPQELYRIQQEAKREQSVSLQNYLIKNNPEAFVPTAWPFRTAETDIADKKAYGLL